MPACITAGVTASCLRVCLAIHGYLDPLLARLLMRIAIGTGHVIVYDAAPVMMPRHMPFLTPICCSRGHYCNFVMPV